MMATLLEPALLLLIWQGVWALDIPLEGESATSSFIVVTGSHLKLYLCPCSPTAPYHNKTVDEGPHR